MVLALLDDLMFRSKLDAAAASLGVTVTAKREIPADVAGVTLVVVDLNADAFDPIAAVRSLKQTAPQLPIIAFCSHVQTDLIRQAEQAGCTEVLARSAFVQRLPELLAAAGSRP